MRKTKEQVKQELLKRKEAYLTKRNKLKKQVIASLLCVVLIMGVFTAIILATDDKQPSSVADDSSENIYVADNSLDFTRDEDSHISESYTNAESSEENGNGTVVDSSEESSAPPEESAPSEMSIPSDEPDDTGIKMTYPTVLENGESLDLLKTLSRQEAVYEDIGYEFTVAETDFAAELFKGCALGEENALISPLSVLMALAMTANGAMGETKTGMEKALGGLTVDKLNSYLGKYISELPNDEYAKLEIANAIWINQGFGINEYFLQDCLDNYGADAYMARFSEVTRTEINGWISDNTDGQIKDMLKEIDPEMLFYIINTLDFEARWRVVYAKNNIVESSFSNADGSASTVEFMYDSASMDYIETEGARGFVKEYWSGYSFVALLPTDEDGLDALVSSMTGEKIRYSLENQCSEHYIDTSIPKFSIDCNISSEAIKDTLSKMGMSTAFEPTANFKKIFDTAYIEKILHSTSITIDELGTKAGAVTVVSGEPGCPPLYATVHLDRPFMYMIIDNQLNIPIFMGTVTNLG